MKKKDYHNLSVEEISKKISDLNSELIKIRGQAATGSTQKNTMQIRQIKKLLARLITLKSQKENPKANNTKNTEKNIQKKSIKETKNKDSKKQEKKEK